MRPGEKLRALFIANGMSTGEGDAPVVSGGDVFAIKMAARWMELNVEVQFLTTSAGAGLCERMGLRTDTRVLPGWTTPTARSGIARVLWSLTSSTSDITDSRPDVIVTSNEGLTDVIPAWRVKRFYTGTPTWASIVHFVPVPPRNRSKARRLDATLYYANHYSGAQIIRIAADLHFAVSESTAKDYMAKMRFSPSKTYPVPAGIDMDVARRARADAKNKVFDGLYLKRFHPMKGTYDLVEIWKQVVNRFPQAKLAIAGTGPENVATRLKEMISDADLHQNITLLGPIYDVEAKYSLISSSKVFLLPSYEENWAIVIGEALACEVPVVAYDLKELRQVWGEYVHYTKLGDIQGFAAEVERLLGSDSASSAASAKRAAEHVSSLDWNNIADGMLSVVAPSFWTQQKRGAGLSPVLR